MIIGYQFMKLPFRLLYVFQWIILYLLHYSRGIISKRYAWQILTEIINCWSSFWGLQLMSIRQQRVTDSWSYRCRLRSVSRHERWNCILCMWSTIVTLDSWGECQSEANREVEPTDIFIRTRSRSLLEKMSTELGNRPVMLPSFLKY